MDLKANEKTGTISIIFVDHECENTLFGNFPKFIFQDYFLFQSFFHRKSLFYLQNSSIRTISVKTLLDIS